MLMQRRLAGGQVDLAGWIRDDAEEIIRLFRQLDLGVTCRSTIISVVKIGDTVINDKSEHAESRTDESTHEHLTDSVRRQEMLLSLVRLLLDRELQFDHYELAALLSLIITDKDELAVLIHALLAMSTRERSAPVINPTAPSLFPYLFRTVSSPYKPNLTDIAKSCEKYSGKVFTADDLAANATITKLDFDADRMKQNLIYLNMALGILAIRGELIKLPAQFHPGGGRKVYGTRSKLEIDDQGIKIEEDIKAKLLNNLAFQVMSVLADTAVVMRMNEIIAKVKTVVPTLNVAERHVNESQILECKPVSGLVKNMLKLGLLVSPSRGQYILSPEVLLTDAMPLTDHLNLARRSEDARLTGSLRRLLIEMD